LKKLAIYLFIWIIAAGVVCGQNLPRVTDIEKYWPEGEKRLFEFFDGETKIGRLEAVMDDVGSKNGRKIYKIREELSLDLTQKRQGYALKAESEIELDNNANFMRGITELAVDEKKEIIVAEFDVSAAEIIIKRENGSVSERRLVSQVPISVLDNFLLDQLELVLAGYDFRPQKNITFRSFSIQGGYITEYEFDIFEKVELQYGPFTDSVWRIEMLRPSRASVYVDRAHRIVKFIDHDQNIAAELTIDPFARRMTPRKSFAEQIDDQMTRLPIYGLYILVSAVWLMFLGRDSYRIRWSYLFFLIGGLLYPVIYITQAPLQKYYAIQVLGPALGAGESIAVPAIIPALLTGLIQESLKFIPLLVAWRWLRLKPAALISLGAFIGAGFGCFEACHIVGPLFQKQVLTGYTLIERVFTIMFHMTMGAVLGFGLARKQIWQFWLIAVGLHALSNYLVVFVQMKVMTIKGLNIVLGLFDIALLAAVTYLQSRYKRLIRMTGK